METRSVSEGPRVDSGENVTCGECEVPRSRFGFPKTHILVAKILRFSPHVNPPALTWLGLRSHRAVAFSLNRFASRSVHPTG
jgi:hypothetical protein